MIEGLTILEGPTAGNPLVGSRFVLPSSFDGQKYASKWVEDGPEIEEARQEQIIPSAGVKALGWEVYKEGDKRQPVARVVGKRKFVLMFRPKQLQKAINSIYADESRNRVNSEILGDTSVAKTEMSSDPGILTNKDLQRVSRSHGEDAPSPIPKSGGFVTNPNEASELQLH